MNFLLIKRYIVLFFWGLLFFPGLAISSIKPVNIDELGIPLIQKYSFPDYCISSGKISVFEDPNGFFLLGSGEKIILFYGNEFVPLNLKGHINVISNQNTVFYTGYNSLGIIRIFKNSLPQFIPLVDEKLKNQSKFGQIDKAYLNDNVIYFNNQHCLYSTSDGSEFTVVDSSKQLIQLFRVNDSVYYNKFECGIFKIIEGQPVPISNVTELKGKNILSILPYKNSLLIRTNEDRAFYLLDNNKVKTIKFGFEDFLDKAGFADALFLPSGNLAIATKSAGILIYNEQQKTINKIGLNEGLLENSINNLHIDKAGNLWAMHDIGLSRIELNVPVSTFGIDAGLSGTVTNILKFRNKLYISTSNGLFVGDYNRIHGTDNFSKLYFTRIVDIVNECDKIFIDNNNLLAFTPTGAYLVDGENTRLIFKDEIKACEQFTLGTKTVYCIGTNKGIKFIKYMDQSFSTLSDVAFDKFQVVDLVADKTNLWIKTSNNHLIRATLNDSLKMNFVVADTSLGITTEHNNFYFLKTLNGVKFCFSSNTYIFDNVSGKYTVEKTVLPGDLEEIPMLTELMTDNYKNKWYNISGTIENLKGILLYKTDENNNAKPFFFNTGTAQSPIYIDSSIVWIGGENKVIRFNNNKSFNFPRKFSATIKRIIIGEDSLLRIQLEDPEIKHKLNDIKFIVSSTCFEGEPYVRYQYRLEGYSHKWSAWDRKSEIVYQNLLPGDYTLQLKALNIDGIVSDVTELKFTILSPFYLTIPAYIIYAIILLFVAFVILRYRTWRFLRYKEEIETIVQERTEEILKEKDKSEQLIANLLPKGTADELKQTGKATSQKFSMATVLFSDIQGFTKIAEQMNPDLLIDQLDAFFFHFDSVVEKYNIEKIKTIGDAYMCAGGIPQKNITNPVEVVLAALEMQEYMADLKSKNAEIWDLRIGIHTGSVIAGVVGHKKMSYDIWGDTVNTASRMESSGEIGKINISGHTYELVKDFFICEYRGKMPVKYKGDIDMYFVKGVRPELSVDMRFTPNKKFFVLLQLLRLQDLEDAIIEKLSKELPSNLYFHNAQRVKEIFNLVNLYGRAEELNEEDNLLARTAALLADTGYIWSYDDHEEMSIKYAHDILPNYKYSEDQINKVVELIQATKRTRKPENKMEEILLDADMNFLARADFISLNDQLFMEQNERHKIESKEDLIKMQVVLLSNHKFYTNVANVLRDVNPEQQIENLLQNHQKTDRVNI